MQARPVDAREPDIEKLARGRMGQLGAGDIELKRDRVGLVHTLSPERIEITWAGVATPV